MHFFKELTLCQIIRLLDIITKRIDCVVAAIMALLMRPSGMAEEQASSIYADRELLIL